MTAHAKSVQDYRSDTLEAILADYQKKARKDSWDKQRIDAIMAELKKRRKAMA